MEKENIITEQTELRKNFISILKGAVLAIIISTLLLLVFAILLCYTNLSENTMKPVVFIITGISIFIGSMCSSRKIRKNGIVNGGIVGFAYIIILYITSSLFIATFSLSLSSAIMILIGTITGMLGGIIGVNLSKI